MWSIYLCGQSFCLLMIILYIQMQEWFWPSKVKDLGLGEEDEVRLISNLISIQRLSRWVVLFPRCTNNLTCNINWDTQGKQVHDTEDHV